MTDIRIVRGSVIDQDVDFIVNAANTLMRGGGGVDGEIHRRAGRKLLLELQRVAPKGCNVGDVVVTGAHELPHAGIIHTPGPIWRGGNQNEATLLASSYRNSLEAANERRARSIAFCSISTGTYGYPLELASEVALSTAKDWIQASPVHNIELIVFALYSAREFDAFQAAFAKLQV